MLQAEQAGKGIKLPGGFPRWDTLRIRALVGVSGVYNCHDLADHFDRRGLYKGLFNRIMAIDGQPQLKLFSPTYCIKVGCAHACLVICRAAAPVSEPFLCRLWLRLTMVTLSTLQRLGHWLLYMLN